MEVSKETRVIEHPMKRCIVILPILLIGPSLAIAGQTQASMGTIRIEVQSEAQGVSEATVIVNGMTTRRMHAVCWC